MLLPGKLYSWRLWSQNNQLTLMISVLPKHLACSGMSFWSLGLSKSQMIFAIIILIGSHKMHNWAIRLLVWGADCRVFVAILKVWKLGWTSKQQIKLPLSWLVITIRCRRRRLKFFWNTMHGSNGRCKHRCHHHEVPGNHWQRGLRKMQRKASMMKVLTQWRWKVLTFRVPRGPSLEEITADTSFCNYTNWHPFANVLAGIPKSHSMVGGITVKDELERLWKGDMFCKKMKETAGDK